jgi:glutathione synthase/RimK-type ligase-like ATP-grasp enzyme
MKLGILTAFRDLHTNYVRACEELGIEHQIIDIIGDDWLRAIGESDCDGFLCRPPSKFQERKMLFDERLFIINKIMKRPIYPSYDELLIYENKRLTSYWLKLHGIPHPETHVFYRKPDFLEYLKNSENYPLVLKSNTGSAAKGVRIVTSRMKARLIANMLFGLGNTKLAFGYTSQKTGRVARFPALGTLEKHSVIVQKFEKIRWEWRIVRIGDSYFGHKKLLRGGFASGSARKEWGAPPSALLLMVRDLCNLGGFLSMSVDILETTSGDYLVNELQSLFGQKTENLMYVDGVPGRLIMQNNDFVFEEGSFNRHCSYKLRVEHFVRILKKSQDALPNRT